MLAYLLLVAIEKRCLDQSVHTSWWTLRQELNTHQIGTVVLPTPRVMRDVVMRDVVDSVDI
jgi:hypothetical protein